MARLEQNFIESLGNLEEYTRKEDSILDYLPFSMDMTTEMYSSSIEPRNVTRHLLQVLPTTILEDPVEYFDIVCALKNVYWGGFTDAGKYIVRQRFQDTPELMNRILSDWDKSEFSDRKYSHRAIAEILERTHPVIYYKWQMFWIQPTYDEIIHSATKGKRNYGISDVDVATLLYKINWLDYTLTRGRWYMMNERRILEENEGCVGKMILELNGKNKQWRYNGVTHTSGNIETEGLSSTYIESFHIFLEYIGALKPQRVQSVLGAYFKCKINPEMNADPERMLWANGKMTVAKTTGISVVTPHIEDMYTMKTGCDFPETKPPEDELRDLFEWLDQAYPGGTREFMLTDWASFLHGVNLHRKVRSWIGVGANSKSRLLMLIKHVFGDYCVTSNQSIVMDANDLQAATTELAKAMFARVICINEPSVNIPLSAEMLKIISGGDEISYRRLYGESTSGRLMAKIIIACNNIPKIKNADRPVRERFEAHPHLGKWCNNPNDRAMRLKYKYLYKIDPRFDDRIPQLARALAWVLVKQYYPRYVKWIARPETRVLPEVFAAEQEYQWRKVCDLSAFIHDYVKKTTTDKYILIRDISSRFTQLYRDYRTTSLKILDERVKEMYFQNELVNDTLYGYYFTPSGHMPEFYRGVSKDAPVENETIDEEDDE